jgi:hypothetical protein
LHESVLRWLGKLEMRYLLIFSVATELAWMLAFAAWQFRQTT